jgi:hypothetical protein
MFHCTIYRLFVVNRSWKRDSPNIDIEIRLLDMHRSWTKSASWKLKSDKWRKWCTFISHFLFNNTYGLTVHTMGTKRPNQLFYVWLVDLQTICAKYVLETWLFPNKDIEIRLLDMQRSWTKNASWNLKSEKWRKWYKLLSTFLFINTYGLTVHTMGTKCPNEIFYVWLVDLQIICAK